MPNTLDVLLGAATVLAVVVPTLWLANFVSYRVIKDRVLRERRWDYNICCGQTDGGGINADIVQFGAIPNFELVTDVTRLPHADQAFGTVLCSHTLEHVDDPAAMFAELRRVGRRVTILVPPLWDLGAALNPFEHRVIFLTFRTRHEDHLPPYIAYRPARWLQRWRGQRVVAHTPGARVLAWLTGRGRP
jgi:SAM-dependent methyltransferase